MAKDVPTLLLAGWVVGCAVMLIALVAKTETRLLAPSTLVHPQNRPEPELDLNRAGRIRFRWIYVDEESWQRAHAQWVSELVPVMKTRPYREGVALLIAGVVLWSVSFWGTRRLIAHLWSHSKSEGSRRLSVVIGVAASVMFVWTMTGDGMFRLARKDWIELMTGIPVSFAVGFSIVCVIVWVQEGFLKDRI